MLHAHFTTSEGDFTIQLFDDKAPQTVANFVGLAEGTKEWTDPKSSQRVKRPYYDGLVFHRADPVAVQRLDVISGRRKHAPHLVVAPLGHGDAGALFRKHLHHGGHQRVPFAF
mgnify:CR=1 FL=1